jgi:hypothetical protein
MTAIPYTEQLKCVRREIAMRMRVYPRWVTDRRMTQQKADYEIEAMQAVAATLEHLVKTTEPDLLT